MKCHLVPFDGREVTLRELAQITGLKMTTLKDRWWRGDRGEKLIRPLDTPKGRQSSQHSQERRKRGYEEYVNGRRARQAEEHAARLEKQTEERKRMERARTEHAAAFSRPLIDASLVSERERREVQGRIGRVALAWRCG